MDWIKGAVGLVKTPARPQQERPPPNAPDGIDEIDDRTAAEVAGRDAGEAPPEHPIEIEPERPNEPERPPDIAPAAAISVEPERPIGAAPASRSFIPSDSRGGVEPAGPPSPEEIDRQRAVVRAFFNDYWSSVEDKPASFAERLDGAEAYINERVAAGGEAWRLDPATRKLLGLPPSRKP